MLVVLPVVEIVVLIAGLAFFLWWVGSLLTQIAATLEAGGGLGAEIVDDGARVHPGRATGWSPRSSTTPGRSRRGWSTSTAPVAWWRTRSRTSTGSPSRSWPR